MAIPRHHDTCSVQRSTLNPHALLVFKAGKAAHKYREYNDKGICINIKVKYINQWALTTLNGSDPPFSNPPKTACRTAPK